MNFSNYAEHYSSQSGIVQLMEDLSVSPPEGATLYHRGGGNPAHIQEVQDAIRDSAAGLIADADRFARMIGDYDAPQGHEVFRACLADQRSSLFGAKSQPSTSP